MKTALLQLICANAFAGLDHEDPHNHLIKFYELCGTVGATQDDEESIFLRLFPFSLVGKAKDWLLDQPNFGMLDWDNLEEKFLSRYFPHSKLLDAKTNISMFRQESNEGLFEAWERFKSMLRKCPGHGFDEKTQVHLFRNGLLQQLKLLLDATAGGSLLEKSATKAFHIIEAMASSEHQSQHQNEILSSKELPDSSISDMLLAQNRVMAMQLPLLQNRE